MRDIGCTGTLGPRHIYGSLSTLAQRWIARKAPRGWQSTTACSFWEWASGSAPTIVTPIDLFASFMHFAVNPSSAGCQRAWSILTLALLAMLLMLFLASGPTVAHAIIANPDGRGWDC